MSQKSDREAMENLTLMAEVDRNRTIQAITGVVGMLMKMMNSSEVSFTQAELVECALEERITVIVEGDRITYRRRTTHD